MAQDPQGHLQPPRGLGRRRSRQEEEDYEDEDEDDSDGASADENDVRHDTDRCWDSLCSTCPVPRIRYAEDGTRHQVRDIDGRVRVVVG